jgi:hypothetical protein
MALTAAIADTSRVANRPAPDQRKIAAQELAKAQIVLIDAEDALKAAQELVATKAKAFEAARKGK